MPRRKAAEVEILAPEDQSARGRKKLVEAEHTIKYSAPVPVTVEEDPEEDNSEDGPGFIEEMEGVKRRRKTAKDERDSLRREMDKLGVASVSRLKLSIDKYRNSDSDESGTLAEKDYCEKYPVTKEHILNDDYMAVARKYGAGRYWFTLRMDNKIVRQWERQVNQALTPSGPVIQQTNPADPNSPTVIYQTANGDGQQVAPMPSMKEWMKAQREALKEQLEMAKLMREAYGFAPEQHQEQKSEEEIIASAIIKQPHVIETVVESIIKRAGVKGGNDSSDTPWWADMLKDSITTGQLAPTVQGIVKALFPNGLFGGLFPGGQNNGQPPMATPPLQTNRSADNQGTADGRTVVAQEVPQGNQSLQSTSGEVDQQSGMLPAPQDPYAQMLTGIITTLANNGPVEEAIKRLDGFLLMAPQYTEAIDAQFSQPAENLLGAISTIPGCEQIAQAEHAKGWIESFQAKFFEESQEGDE